MIPDKKLLAVTGVLAAAAALSGCLLYAQVQVKKQARDSDEKIALLQKQISALGGKIIEQSSSTASQFSVLSETETSNRQAVREKSQDQQLTDAVAGISPSVVSIVISKDVPQLEVTYVNPFGDDPFFKDVGIRVPVYTQKGTVKQKTGAGTGFIITSNGYILTNKHVVSDTDAEYTVLLSDGSQKTAQVIFKDPGNDLAVIKIDGKYSSVTLGDSGTLKLGQSVFAVGNALGEYNNSVSVGIVSGLNRTIDATDSSGNAETLSGVIQTDAAINPGNSGGPLVDLDGKVVGINVATVQGSSNISFSIPINSVKDTIKFVLGK